MTNVGSKRGHSKQKERIADAVHVFNAIGSNNPMVREVISPSPVRRTSPDLRRAITRSRVPPQPDRIIQTLRGTAASRPVSASNSESKKETSHQGYLQRVRMQCADDGLMRKGKDDRFFCQLCSMNYVRKKDCRTHIRKHHAIGASVDTTPSDGRTCPFCKKREASREALNSHTRIVHHHCFNCRKETVMAARGYVCPECKE